MKEKLMALKKEWDIMKISINAINSFNGKLYNEETKKQLFSLLTKGREKKYFTSQSSKQEIVVTLRFGEIKIFGEEKQLRVEIQEETKKNIVNFKNEIGELTKVYMEMEHAKKQEKATKEENNLQSSNHADSIPLSTTEHVASNPSSIQQTISQPVTSTNHTVVLEDPYFEELAAFAEEVF